MIQLIKLMQYTKYLYNCLKDNHMWQMLIYTYNSDNITDVEIVLRLFNMIISGSIWG